jgi:hypothetical protein
LTATVVTNFSLPGPNGRKSPGRVRTNVFSPNNGEEVDEVKDMEPSGILVQVDVDVEEGDQSHSGERTPHTEIVAAKAAPAETQPGTVQTKPINNQTWRLK